MAASTVAAAIANLLLDRGDGDDAFAVLQPASIAFPQDLRFSSCWCCATNAASSWIRRWKRSARCSRSKDDDETAGIVGGVYKQVYLDRGRDPDVLLKSFRAYLAGWESGKCSNTYLGINAAATALWLGRAAEARKLAEQVKQLLQKRAAALADKPDFNTLPFCLWDEVTLAEAELLSGEFSATRKRYNAAFDQWKKQRGNIAVAKEQASRHLAPLGLTLSSDEFFGAPISTDAAKPLVVGVTGHRSLADESVIRQRIDQASAQLIPSPGTPGEGQGGGVGFSAAPITEQTRRPIVLLSSLAAGADCLVAEALLDKSLGRLHVVLPLELAEYHRDFSSAELARFQALLNQAEKIIYPQPTPTAKPQKPKARFR